MATRDEGQRARERVPTAEPRSVAPRRSAHDRDTQRDVFARHGTWSHRLARASRAREARGTRDATASAARRTRRVAGTVEAILPTRRGRTARAEVLPLTEFRRGRRASMRRPAKGSVGPYAWSATRRTRPTGWPCQAIADTCLGERGEEVETLINMLGWRSRPKVREYLRTPMVELLPDCAAAAVAEARSWCARFE